MKTEPTGVADKMDVRRERKGGDEYERKIFHLSSWKDGADMTADPEMVWPAGGHGSWEWGDQKVKFGRLRLRCPLDSQAEM